MKENINIAIVGWGIMGERHYDSLRKYNVDDIFLVRRTAEMPAGKNLKGVYTSLSDLCSEVDVHAAIICTPSSLHLRDMEVCLRNGVSFLVEKPVVTTMEDAIRLLELCQENPPRIAMVGYDLRYTQVMLKFKEIINGGIDMGKLYFCQWDAGGYMPQWRPQKDYRSMYSARSELGGGVAMDLSHEVDAMTWFFGIPEEVTGKVLQRSTLDIDVDDVAFMSFEYSEKSFTVNITVDYCRVPFTRAIRLVAEKGTLEIDEVHETIEWFPVHGNAEKLFQAPASPVTPFNVEIENYLEGIVHNDTSLLRGTTMQEGLNTVGLIEAARKSSRSGKVENVTEFLL